MKKFLDENFLLSNETSVKLFHDYAKAMPIYDYHCHLNPKEIWENKKYKNITEIWLYGDHYKWRAMRSNGIDERYITGDASDYDKFIAWAETVSIAIGSPLYHWTHLELQRYFGIHEVLNEKNAASIWEKANDLINKEGFTTRDLIKRSNVKVICTTDDPLDSLEYHSKIKDLEGFSTVVLPTFRPDKGIEINKEPFLEWIENLGKVCKTSIDTYEKLLGAFEERVNFFHSQGCRLADHGMEYVPYAETNFKEVSEIFAKKLAGQLITKEEEDKYKTNIFIFLGKLYSKLGWVMQLHTGAMRSNNTRMLQSIGVDTGFDSINDLNLAYPLSRLMDALEIQESLPKTILYTLNPKDNYVLGTMIGNFQGGNIKGKIQFGAAWWFNDQKDGMLEQMKALANLGLLSRFVGMLTDSRSFMSYTRHEYFRRILCNLIGEWVENGELPEDFELLGKIVQDISYNNAKEYFDIQVN